MRCPVLNEEPPPALSWRPGPSAPLLCFLLAGAHWGQLLYQEVEAAASLALVCMSFPLVSWATFSSGCLGNQPLLLKGEDGQRLAKTDHG